MVFFVVLRRASRDERLLGVSADELDDFDDGLLAFVLLLVERRCIRFSVVWRRLLPLVMAFDVEVFMTVGAIKTAI